MRSNEIERYKKTLLLSDLQREVLIGTLLGDGHLETQNRGRTYRLKIEHIAWQKEYTDWLYQIFQEWVLTSPQEKIQIIENLPRKKYWFSTISHGAFRFYAQQFYKEKRKVLPKLMQKWLSPLVMAVWFMDDGSIKSKHHRALILNSQCFTKEENLKLIETIQKKFGITMSLRPQRNLYQLYIGKDSVQKFVDLIQPYVLPSMRYKLGKLGNTIA
ncbi:MAG: LAGLIDADG endonuclease [Patescibacteria group bacterium]